ncbi:glycosyltransferase family 2 protein [Bifidobacterium sp. CP2]|uniref:glycosyltransferase family 2 protein n=1 Tax=Bifidobacterium TaxID=1678 RepID=UPI001BDCBF24|nr:MULTISPECIES: glycosyltransferase family 2 protein [Bifidobacterium]MBT1182015.1 glycosyltransferase family 2 protein [Bifidobacterium sp. CP2]MBW3081335.1 glycosyltransferase family 2 protein [Bifidobacterium saguinibicoloris]
MDVKVGEQLVSDRRTITVLIPCYNEQESLPLLFERMDALVGNTSDIEYTVLFVDDGSKDETRPLIKRYAREHAYVEYIFLSRNFGKEKAMYAGIENVHTDGLVIIDADLQDPPELIPQMAELWRQGYDDVYARRRSREGESWLKKATSRWYYDLLQKVSGVAIQKDTGDFRLLDRKCIDALKRLNESERNSKALFSWIGFKKIEFLYDRDKRVAGKTKWNYMKLFHLAMDGITSFTTMPLKIATWAGSLVSFAAIVYAIVILVRTLAWGVDVPGYASTMVVVLILGGIQLLSLGIIGEYLGRVFMQTKNRPNYLVQEQHIVK